MKPEENSNASQANPQGSLQQPGSGSASCDPLRQKVIRVVLQVSDTPKNEKITLDAIAAIKRLGSVEGHGVLKREHITIASLEVPQPISNADISDRR